MAGKKIAFDITRYKPGQIDPPRVQSYTVAVDRTMTVLDGLEQIRLTQDATLMYRHSCHHSACGTCACVINGLERLACTTRSNSGRSGQNRGLSLFGCPPEGRCFVKATAPNVLAL